MGKAAVLPITDKVSEEMAEWSSRLLSRVHAVQLDAITSTGWRRSATDRSTTALF